MVFLGEMRVQAERARGFPCPGSRGGVDGAGKGSLASRLHELDPASQEEEGYGQKRKLLS